MFSKRNYKLTIRKRYAMIIVKKSFSGIYSFIVTQKTSLPLFAPRKMVLSPNMDTISFDYICSGPIAYLKVGIDEKTIVYRNIDTTNRWQTLSIDLTPYKDVLIRCIPHKNVLPIQLQIFPQPTSHAFPMKIKNIHLRERTKDEVAKAEMRYKAQIRKSNNPVNLHDYLYKANFQCNIKKVHITSEYIKIEGSCCHTDEEFHLCEIPMYEELAEDRMLSVAEIKGKVFSIRTDRYATREGMTYDRLYSRWAIATCTEKGYALCSYARYADSIEQAFAVPMPHPKNKKGLGGFKYNDLESDLDELGISYITFNIRINNFLRLHPGTDVIPFEYGGKTYYADAAKIAKYDRALSCAAKRGIDVSAIILVYPENRSRDKEVGRLLEHPDYDSAGAYTMPNMTNPKVLNLYAAAIDFLAARYSRPDGRYGLIHRWIVHNEVDAGWIWANAGRKNILEYMDTYHKSMRLVYLTARKYNSNAETLISLTHFWHKPNPERYCYAPDQLLKILINYCRAEGDFQWGIGYHPYPQNLANPRVWRETQARRSPDTEFITFNNLEVLDAWIKQPETFYNGRKRTLLLSEQNPNSPDYSDRSLKEQAACLAYAWKKVMACSGIDAYIAHSWIDARFEGGLKTGLRKYPDDETDPYGCKPSWHLYRDLATEREEASCAFAKEIIGIGDWKDIIDLTPIEKEKQ